MTTRSEDLEETGRAAIVREIDETVSDGGGFNLGLAMRQCLGLGKPRRLQGLAAAAMIVFIAMWARLQAIWGGDDPGCVDRRRCRRRVIVSSCYPSPRESQGLNTGC